VPPDFHDWIDSLGIPVTPIGPELRKATASSPPATPAPPSPERRRQLAEATVATLFETITAAAQGYDIIVAATALQIAARSVAERMGIPYVFAAYCPTVLPSPHHAPPPLPPLPGQTPAPATADNRELWDRDAERFNDLFGNALNSHRASMGLASVSDARSYIFTDRPWLNCLAIDEVNQQALFKRVAAVVHHGGAGTTTNAALAGAPQVVVPQIYDQHYWAHRLHDLGIGTAHAPGTPTTDSLTGALEHTLQADVAARAQSIATAVRRDGAQAAPSA
jgi:UDP:flavonoid glycosyltransferase YjiC (YdhE family)